MSGRSAGSMALVAVLVIGAAERLVLSLSYRPAILSYPDTFLYAVGAAGPIFLEDPIRPAGYTIFLAALDFVGGIGLTIAFQHLLGLATAAIAYVLFRRLGAPTAVALVPAAAFALTPDQLYFEHSILSEGLFAFVVGASLLAAAPVVGPRPVDGRRRLAWAAASGGLLALAVTIRVAGIFAIPVAALALLVGGTRGLRRRASSSLVLVASAAAVLLFYAGAQRTQIDYLGLTQGGPWSLYARVAPFADCERFTPPSGTEGLCERSDWRRRPGPDFYAWDPRSPGHRLFGGPPRDADKVGAFARAALVAQPGLYVRAVAKDLVRYVDSSVGFERPDSGGPPHRYALDGRYARTEAVNLAAIRPLYGEQRIEVGRAVRILAGVQEIVRIHGVLVLLSALGLVAGVAAGRRHLAALLLVGGTSTVPIAMSTATTIYDYRYAVPLLPFLLGSGAWGLWLAAGLGRRRREPIAPEANSAPE